MDRQKVWTYGWNGHTDDAKTISLRLRQGIIKKLHAFEVAIISLMEAAVFVSY